MMSLLAGLLLAFQPAPVAAAEMNQALLQAFRSACDRVGNVLLASFIGE